MSSDSIFSTSRFLGGAALALAVLFAIVSLHFRFSTYINHDVAWYLYSAGRLLDGGRMYQDMFVDVNPPLALYLTVPPVYLARLTGMFSVDMYIVYLCVLMLASLTIMWHLLRPIQGLRSGQMWGLLFALFFALMVLPAADFGQREHIMLILALPYFVLVGLRASGGTCSGPVAIMVGVAAALGLGLKPHFLIVPAALEIYLLVRTRTLRSIFRLETLSMAGTIALYLAVIVLFTPDYVTRVVPLALEVYNHAYQQAFGDIFFRAETIALPIVLLLYATRRRRLGTAALADVFCLSACGFFAIYVFQGKGWTYQTYPIAANLLLTVVASLLGPLAAQANSRGAVRRNGVLWLVPLIGAVVVVVVLLSLRIVYGTVYKSDIADLMAPIVREHDDGSGLYIFATTVSTGFPLVSYTGVRWCSRYSTLWPLPGLQNRLEADEPGLSPEVRTRLNELERVIRGTMVKDFTDCAPALVIVDTQDQPRYFKQPFDYIDFFNSDRHFAKVWADYELIEQVGYFQVYRRIAGRGLGS